MKLVVKQYEVVAKDILILVAFSEIYDPVIVGGTTGLRYRIPDFFGVSFSEAEGLVFRDGTKSKDTTFGIEETEHSDMSIVYALVTYLQREVFYKVWTLPDDREGFRFYIKRIGDVADGACGVSYTLDRLNGWPTIKTDGSPLAILTFKIAVSPTVVLDVPAPDGVWMHYTLIPLDLRRKIIEMSNVIVWGWCYRDGLLLTAEEGRL